MHLILIYQEILLLLSVDLQVRDCSQLPHQVRIADLAAEDFSFVHHLGTRTRQATEILREMNMYVPDQCLAPPDLLIHLKRILMTG